MKLVSYVVAGLLMVLSQQVGAGIMTFTDVNDPTPDVFLSGGQSTSFSHSILDDGFDTNTDTITDIDYSINLKDDQDRDSNTYGYRWSGYCHWSWSRGYHCHGGYRSYVTSYGQTEYAEVWGDGDLLGSTEVDYTPLSLTIDPVNLADGILDITVKNTGGDFYYSWSKLVVEIDRATADVPEPSIIALFAAGLFGIGFARRRKA